ncbi:exodeoxyribonuclease VII large subunit [Atopobiaceae bacterium 24-176]
MAVRPLSVSAAVGLAKRTVEDIPQISVIGEVSGFRGPNARSGHCYFSVKDESSAMDVIVWRGVYQSSGVQLRDGLEITMSGAFQVYERSGRLSFVARRLSLAGEGLLRQRVAELARRLEAEGLMDPARKRAVPAFCERVCVVTSLSGAVIDDVKRTLARRNPLVRIDVVGCSVQGPDAPASIVAGLSAAASTRPDAILLVRGGGSFEDLMAFNDESVARAVAACPVPVVTGIGHEPDHSIADAVADRRCSTPTAAAESVAPDTVSLHAGVNRWAQRLVSSFSHRMEFESRSVDALSSAMAQTLASRLSLESARVEALASRPVLSGPGAVVDARRATVELLADDLSGAMEGLLKNRASFLEVQGSRLGRGSFAVLAPSQAVAESLSGRLSRAAPVVTRAGEESLRRLAASLEALSPLKVIARGYAIVRGPGGSVESSVASLAPGDAVDVTVSDGSFSATVTACSPDFVVPSP